MLGKHYSTKLNLLLDFISLILVKGRDASKELWYRVGSTIGALKSS